MLEKGLCKASGKDFGEFRRAGGGLPKCFGFMSSKGPCTQIVYTLAPMYLYREYFKANVYTIWVHRPSGVSVFHVPGWR